MNGAPICPRCGAVDAASPHQPGLARCGRCGWVFAPLENVSGPVHGGYVEGGPVAPGTPGRGAFDAHDAARSLESFERRLADKHDFGSWYARSWAGALRRLITEPRWLLVSIPIMAGVALLFLVGMVVVFVVAAALIVGQAAR